MLVLFFIYTQWKSKSKLGS